MSDSHPRAGFAFRYALIAVLAVASATGIGWTVGKFGTSGSKPPEARSSQIRGELVYQAYCASCHGPDGHGEGASAASLRPPPQDFAARPWRFAVSRESIQKVTLDGIPGTAMPAFRATLSPAELEAVSAHVHDLATALPAQHQEPTAEERLLRAAGFTDLRHTNPPPLTITAANGKCVKLSDLRGKLVLLHFWGTGCVHCIKEIPALNELEKSHAGRLAVLQVCTEEDDPAAAQQVLDRVAPGNVSYTDLTGLGLARFEVSLLPTVWLIDSSGQAIGRASGAKDWRSEPLRDLIFHFLPQERK